jgi:hypothetical protein
MFSRVKKTTLTISVSPAISRNASGSIIPAHHVTLRNISLINSSITKNSRQKKRLWSGKNTLKAEKAESIF